MVVKQRHLYRNNLTYDLRNDALFSLKTLLTLISTGRNHCKMHLCAPPAATAAAAAATLIDENSGLGLGEPW